MKQSLGQWGEDYAVSYLTDRGWEIKFRNYDTPYGECDLVITNNQVTAMVEVKTRSSRDFGVPEVAVTREKRRHLRRVARHYLSEQDEPGQLRFDVLAIEFDPDSPDVRHIEGAFEASS